MTVLLVVVVGVFAGVNIGLVLSGWAERRVRADVDKARVITEAERLLKDHA